MKHLYIYLLILLIGMTGCQPMEQSSAYDMMGLEEITIEQLHEGYQNGDFTIAEVTQAYLKRIEDIDQNGPELNSIIAVNPDAMEIAKQLDQELADGNIRGPMHGVPVVLKDNIDTNDRMPNTAGSRIMARSYPDKDSFITARLRESGAVIIGKANLSEWANFHSSFSSSGWSGLGGQTKNPYDISRNPCGSSAGSGVAVSANLTMIAIGTETNGSITCPSNNNGIVGIKPTVGLLSRSGIIPISFTQDTPGPMARTVRDAAIALGAMTGVDPDDSKTLASEDNFESDYTQFLNEGGLEGKRIGFYTAPLGRHFRLDTLVYQARRFLEEQGATIVELEQIAGRNVGGDSYNILLYEFKDGLNEYFASLGEDAPVTSLEELIEATLADSVEMHYFDHDILLQAQEKGDLESEEYLQALDRMLKYSREEGIDKIMNENDLDAIFGPTGGPAWKTDLTNGDNFGTSSSSPAARAGYPHVTVPMANIDGLPVNISFFGRAWSEPELLEIAYAFEQATQARIIPTFKGY